MNILDFVEPSRLDAVRAANQRALGRVDRSARSVVNAAANRGAISPAAAAGAAARASNDARAQVADQMAQREADARVFDQGRGARLAGTLLSTAGNVAGLVAGGMTGGAATPAIQGVTNQLASGVTQAAGGGQMAAPGLGRQLGNPANPEEDPMGVLGTILGRGRR